MSNVWLAQPGKWLGASQLAPLVLACQIASFQAEWPACALLKVAVFVSAHQFWPGLPAHLLCGAKLLHTYIYIWGKLAGKVICLL